MTTRACAAGSTNVLKQVERQVQIDEDQAKLEREQHDVHVAAAVACAEAIKRRTLRQDIEDVTAAQSQWPGSPNFVTLAPDRCLPRTRLP